MNNLQKQLYSAIHFISTKQGVKIKTLLNALAPKLNLRKIIIKQLRDSECQILIKCTEFMKDFGWADGLNMAKEFETDNSGPWWMHNSAISERSSVNSSKTQFQIWLR